MPEVPKILAKLYRTLWRNSSVGQKNEKNDMMPIQALFRLVVLDDSLLAKKNFGLDLQDLPEPTGVFDDKTVRAILGFQRMSSDFLISSDGRIHPASYQNRVIKLSGRLMTIHAP